MDMKLAQARLLMVWLSALAAQAQSTDLSGKWQIAVMHHGSAEYTRLSLKSADGHSTGALFGDAFEVTLNDGQLEVRCHDKDAKGKECGVLKGKLSDGVMDASGTLYEEASTWTARRAPVISRNADRHEFVPKIYYNQFSGQIDPVLKITPGDTVHTTTVDAG